MTDEQRALVEDNLNVAHFVAHKFRSTFFDYDDLAQMGMVGLCRAAIMYDPSRGVKFSSYAYLVALHEILMELRRKKMPCASINQPIECPSENLVLGDIILFEQDFDERLVVEDVFKVINLLPGKQRQAALMAKDGMAQREIAQSLGVSQPQVSRLLQAAKQTIKREMAG